MAIEAFWASGSPFAWRMLLALEAKRLPYESRLLQFSTGDLRTPEYLAMNPRGKVPTLRDGGYVVYESVAVITYLDAKYPAVPLFGTTPEERGTITRLVVETEAYLQPPLVGAARIVFGGQAQEKAAELGEHAKTVHEELAKAEARLATTPWLAGSAISAADVVLFPFVQIVLRASGKVDADLGFAPLERRYPALAAWTKRVEALPGYERTYPPHWRAS